MKRFGIAPGDPAGIGYEITAKALNDAGIRNLLASKGVIPIVYAHAGIWEQAVSRFAPELRWERVSSAENARDLKGIFLVDAGIELPDFTPGKLSASCARCAYESLMKCTQDVKNGHVSGICTGPIHKGAMRLAGISAIGHTEMLAESFGCKSPMTMFMTRSLNIFFYSRHLSLRQAIDALDIDKLVDFAVSMHHQMQGLGFGHPRFAMAALNPHASDGGQFGTEEARILIPAVEKICDLGINMVGPIGADSVFAQAAKGYYDAVLSLYHDQGHIAAKTYDFERTISATLGLPCLRTSVDHGTAMDIAWTGQAQSISMATAIEKLCQYA